jgi:hypothetical protein
MSYLQLNNGNLQESFLPATSTVTVARPPIVPVKQGATLMNRLFGGRKKRLGKAAAEGNLALVSELIERGANLGPFMKHAITPLMVACNNGHLDVVRYLIARGANVNHRTDDDRTTALMFASAKGYLEIVRVLIASGADVNAQQAVDKNPYDPGLEYRAYFTPLIFASGNGHIDVVKLLCESGADPNMVDKDKRSAIHYAKTPEIKEFLMRGCGTNRVTTIVPSTLNQAVGTLPSIAATGLTGVPTDLSSIRIPGSIAENYENSENYINRANIPLLFKKGGRRSRTKKRKYRSKRKTRK